MSGSAFLGRRGFVPALILGLLAIAGSASVAQDPAGLLGSPPPPPVPAPGQVPLPALGQVPDPGPGPGQVSPDGQVPGGPEVLTRGPIHEAFATPVVFNPATPLVVPTPPPQVPVNEVPPAQKPAGADVEWIPGYWAWDDERNGYIWISGVWRDIPPGRQWIPGYWSQVQGGYGWTAGFWAPAQAEGPLDYLPAPPASLENGPNAPQPGPDFAWAPGSWVWQVDRYNWQPGYWYQAQPNWIWNPAEYESTPSGYVYNQGYWDYSLAQRGIPFAPLAFNNAALGGGGGGGFGGGGYGAGPLTFTPNYVLPAAGLLASLFVRPNYGHYYYGDYYGAAGIGANSRYVPWFGFQNNRLGYDPFYSSMAALNGRQPGWDQRYRDDFRYRVDHQEARPFTNFAAQRAFVDQGRARGADVRNLGLVQPLNQWAANPQANHALVNVNQEHRQELERRQVEMTNFRNQRVQQEERGRQVAAERNVRAEESRQALFRNELPRSPIAAAGNPRFESRGLGAPPVHPPGQNAFRPEFGANRGEVPVVSHRGPEAMRPAAIAPRQELRREPERGRPEEHRGKPR